MQFRVPAAKIAQITSQCARFASRPQLTARDLAELLGRINSVSLACDYASLYSRNMQMCLGSEISAVPDYSRIITLDQPSTEELDWWTTNISEHAARPISLASPTFEITSDASKLGWGAVCNNVRTGGRWSQEEALCHINVLELKASFFALKIFCKDLRRITVRARLDNTTAIAYINKRGGTSRDLNDLSREFWLYALERELTVGAVHLPGIANEVADEESRHFRESAEWSLCPLVTQDIFSKLGDPEVDLFASRPRGAPLRVYCAQPQPFPK
jgi:hypothetical protein